MKVPALEIKGAIGDTMHPLMDATDEKYNAIHQIPSIKASFTATRRKINDKKIIC
jgi:hypothetical protein